MGFSRQECWSGLPFPSPGDLPDQGLSPGLPHCRQTLYRLSLQGSPWHVISNYQIIAEIIDGCEAPCDLASAALSDLISCPFPLRSLNSFQTGLLWTPQTCYTLPPQTLHCSLSLEFSFPQPTTAPPRSALQFHTVHSSGFKWNFKNCVSNTITELEWTYNKLHIFIFYFFLVFWMLTFIFFIFLIYFY